MWKPIYGYDGNYEVNELGQVRKIIMLTPSVNNKGYLRLNFPLNGKQKCAFVHRLVAQAFIENSNNYPQVNHIDGNKKNNNVNNLEWCDNSMNMLHFWRKRNGVVFTDEEKKSIQKEYNSNKECTLKKLAEKYHSNICTIWRIIKEKSAIAK